MGIAITLRDYLWEKGTEYDVVDHPHAQTSLNIAAAAHVPGDRLAKTVVLEDDAGYLLVVIPATHQLRLNVLRKQLNRNLRLAKEFDLAYLFKDCGLGAIPPVGKAYGIETVIAEDLAQQADVYFEAGDHRELIHLSGSQFLALMSGVVQRHITRRVRLERTPC